MISVESKSYGQRFACPTYSIYSVTNIVINTFKDKTMTTQKQITDIKVDPNATVSNVTISPINIILPQHLPHRNDNVWLSSPVKTTPQ
jgi:hypothetical protein